MIRRASSILTLAMALAGTLQPVDVALEAVRAGKYSEAAVREARPHLGVLREVDPGARRPVDIWKARYPASTPVVIAGDLNTLHRHSPVIPYLVKAGYRNCFCPVACEGARVNGKLRF